MKQVTYDFNMFEIMFSLMRDRDHIEDGYWEISFQTESISAGFPEMFQGQKIGTLPGTLIRIIGARMTKVINPGSLTIEIRDGLIVLPREESDGIDRNQHGSIQSSETVGENSGQAGQDIS